MTTPTPQEVRAFVQAIFDRHPDMVRLSPELARPIGTQLVKEYGQAGLTFSNWEEITDKSADQLADLIIAKLGLTI